MTIDQLVAMARRIHDAEGYDLGATSSRDDRNAFWARVVGCAYWGHPVYHPGAGDRQWHLKNGGPGRPQSDDVAVSLPSRAFWDCIGGAGGAGYVFHASGHADPLPFVQEVYAPPTPSGSGGEAPVPPQMPVLDRGEFFREMHALDRYYAASEGLQRPEGLSLGGRPDFEGLAAWIFDVFLNRRLRGESVEAARAAYVHDIRQSVEWQQKHPGEQP